MNAAARWAMRLAGAAHSGIYRVSRGRVAGSVKGMPLFLLTVPGRRTGVPHTVPCVYLDEGGSWLVAGSAGGMTEEPQWFKNLRATDRAEIELEGVRRPVRARELRGDERDAAWGRLVARAPFFEGYQAKVERVIPIAVLTPSSPGEGAAP